MYSYLKTQNYNEFNKSSELHIDDRLYSIEYLYNITAIFNIRIIGENSKNNKKRKYIKSIWNTSREISKISREYYCHEIIEYTFWIFFPPMYFGVSLREYNFQLKCFANTKKKKNKGQRQSFEFVGLICGNVVSLAARGLYAILSRSWLKVYSQYSWSSITSEKRERTNVSSIKTFRRYFNFSTAIYEFIFRFRRFCNVIK